MVPLPYRTIASHSHSLVGFAGLCVAGIETLQSNHVLIVAFCFLLFLSLSHKLMLRMARKIGESKSEPVDKDLRAPLR